MKTKLLLLLLVSCLLSYGQTTHMITWSMNYDPQQASITINPGDTVMWMWGDPVAHTVTSGEDAAEQFDSGVLSGMAMYSHTFTQLGENPYFCQFHFWMQGVITVSNVAGVQEAGREGFLAFPNPVTNILTVTSALPITRIAIFDITGKEVFSASADTPIAKIYMAGYPAGNYLVKAFSGDLVKDITVVKQ